MLYKIKFYDAPRSAIKHYAKRWGGTCAPSGINGWMFWDVDDYDFWIDLHAQLDDDPNVAAYESLDTSCD
jgi:hypothetical protein